MVSDFPLAKNAIAFTFATPAELPEPYLLQSGATAVRPLTSLNAEILSGKAIAETEPFTFVSMTTNLKWKPF